MNSKSLAKIRSDFPILERRIDGKPIIYLDSAATSLKPQPVLDAERAYSTEFTANIHRGKHTLSEEASVAYEDARRTVARFLSARPRNVVFVRNATEGINLVARGIGLRRDDVVVAWSGDHHSNLVPWMREAPIVMMEGDATAPMDLDQLAEVILLQKPRLLAISHASNVSGVVQPLGEICHLARRYGVTTVVDASQSAPHMQIDVVEIGCDFLTFSGHKMLGSTGIGVLWGREEALETLEPLILGGGMLQKVTRSGYTLKPLPLRLEAGTPNVSGAIGLAAAIEYLEDIGFDALQEHECRLAEALEVALCGLSGARVIMARSEPRLALAQIVPEGKQLSPDHLAVLLSDTHKIMVRSGLHCANPFFDGLGIPLGGVRASAYLYNTVDEIETFGKAVGSILQRFVVAA